MAKVKKNFGVKIVLLIILLLISSESLLRMKKGVLPVEFDTDDFNYRYADIHKRFFKLSKLGHGEIVCKAQRSRTSIKEFRLNKEKNTKRIFVVGGSVAIMFNIDVVLQKLLGDLSGDCKFEVIGCGMGGYDSYRDSLVLNEVLSYHPDLIIVMSGNNEFFTPVDLNLFAYRCNRVLERLWIYRLLRDKFIKQKKFSRISEEGRIINFQRNLEGMLRKAKKKNVPIAFCTLPVNFRDSPPIGKQLLEEKEYFFGWYNLNEGNFEQAEGHFRKFLLIHPKDAFAAYFLAKCYDNLGDYAQAQKYYLEALTLNVSVGDRCIPGYNIVIRQLCLREGAVLIDLEKKFIDVSPDGLVGSNLFMDNCHWWERYHWLVYEEVAQSLCKYDNPSLKLSLEQQGKIESLLKDFKKKTEGNIEEDSFRVFMCGLSELKFQLDIINERGISLIGKAYQLNPEMFKERSFLKKNVSRELSENIWTQTISLDDIWPVFLYHLGEFYRRVGLYDQAIECFNDAIAVSEAGFWPLFLSRGVTYYKIGKIEDAKKDLYKAGEISRDNPLVQFYKELISL